MTNNNPVFSIIMPIYNVEKYIKKSLESIKNQTFTNYELICVNDCTPDNSMNIVKKFAKFDNRIKIVNKEKNGGCGSARNEGFKHVTGKYLCFVDPDDWIDSDFLQEMYNAFSEHPEYDSIWIKPWVYYEKTDTATIFRAVPHLAHHLTGELILSPQNIINYPVTVWNKAYKIDLIKKNNIKWSEYKYWEEHIFYWHYFILFPKVYVINKMLYYYRIRNKSTVRNSINDRNAIIDMYSVFDDIVELIKNNKFDENYINTLIKYIDLYNNQYSNHPLFLLVLEKHKKFIQKTNLKN